MEYVILLTGMLCVIAAIVLWPRTGKTVSDIVYPEADKGETRNDLVPIDDEEPPSNEPKTPFVAPQVKPISGRELKDFEAVDSLWYNPSEHRMFIALRQAVPFHHHVHGKVRLEDIIRVRSQLWGKLESYRRGRVKSRHVDYLITNNKGRPVLAIELDGRSHDSENPSEADKVKTALFAAAGIPLRRVRVGEDFDHIAATIATELNGS